MKIKFTYLKYYLKRYYDPTFEMSEIERAIVHQITKIPFKEKISKAVCYKVIRELMPPLHPNINVDELDHFLNSIKIEATTEKFYNMLGSDQNVRHARQQKSLFEYNQENERKDVIYQYLVSEYGTIGDLETLIYQHNIVLSTALNTAHYNAFCHCMSKVANFQWKHVNDFENLLLKAECALFEKEIQTQLNLNDSESYNEILHDAYELELNEHDIILSTCIATSTSVLSKIKNFKQLIIDEAGMTKEPEALVPILLCNPEKVVLIGDHEQLRPIIKCQNARDLGLDQSLFERYCQKVTMLEDQYRMHDSICNFPSKTFYNGQLNTKAPNHSSAVYWPGKYFSKNSNNVDDLKSEMRVVFIDIKGKESKLAVHSNEGSENSVRNDAEIDCVEKLYKYLAEDNTKKTLVEHKDIVILSQYRAQVKGIISRLKVTDERVLTVITSQGGEWDYVILSTVRSLPDCDIDSKPTDGWRKKYLGFISDKNQVNVALTRAKRGLFIIGMFVSSFFKYFIEDFNFRQQKLVEM